MLASLGVGITTGRPRLRTLMAKQSRIGSATRELVRIGHANGKELEVLLGSWVWILLPCRLALSVCDRVYDFTHRYREILKTATTLFTSVIAELTTLVALLPLIFVELDAGWRRWAYMLDASLSGFGVVCSAATVEEPRLESKWAERRG